MSSIVGSGVLSSSPSFFSWVVASSLQATTLASITVGGAACTVVAALAEVVLPNERVVGGAATGGKDGRLALAESAKKVGSAKDVLRVLERHRVVRHGDR